MYLATDSARIAVRDGVRLATDVYLPQAASRRRRVPAVLARTPYDMRANPVWFAAIAALFNDAGLAFVAQDTRGRFRSEGVATPFASEAADGYDTITWIEKQRWSNGVVGVFGESYVGFTAYAAAASRHPAVRAMATRESTTDVERDWMRHQGVFRLQAIASWAAATWSGPGSPEPDLPWSVRPLSALVTTALHGRDAPVLHEWAAAPAGHAYWPTDRGWPHLIDRIEVPSHFAVGWWDLFQRGQLRDWYYHASTTECGSELVVTSTDHAGRDWSDGPTVDPLTDLGGLARSLPSVMTGEVDFFRHHLLGTNRREPPRVRWQLTHGGDRVSDTWPPAGHRRWQLFLVGADRAAAGPEGGALRERPDRVPVTARWVHDPENLVPSLDGDVVNGQFRRPDEREVQVRSDVLTFTSDAIRQPVDLAGPIAVRLTVSSSATSAHLMAKLTDVYPDGPARLIAEGAALVRPLRDRVSATIDLGHTGYRVRRGHRIRLEVAGSSFPRYIWHPGHEDDPWTARHGQLVRLGLVSGECDVTLTIVPNEV